MARMIASPFEQRGPIGIVPGDCNGLTFCTGTIGAMPENVLDAIRYFGSRGKIFHIHFRSVAGPVPKFSETFIGEGNLDMMEAMKAFHVAGVDAPIVEDHVPA